MGILNNNPDNIDVRDCGSTDFFQLFRQISRENTLIYDQVFKCLPSDNILNFTDLRSYPNSVSLNKTNPNEAKRRLDCVKGFIVDFPLEFLSNEKKFFPDFVTAEGILPKEMWT